MGKGVVSSSGGAPWRKFKARVAFVGSEVLTTGVRDLLSGDAVRSSDGELEISSLALEDDSHAVTLTVRSPDADWVVDVVVSPLPGKQDAKGGDSRNPLPTPDQWRKPKAGGVEWELFNCEVVLVKLREN